MPSPFNTSRPIKLYMAKSVNQLNDLIDKNNDNVNGYPLKNLLKSFGNTHQKALECLQKGDEEKSYVYFMRAYSVYKHASLMKDYIIDKRYYDDNYRTKLADCINKCEMLADSLERRYKLLEESNSALKREKIENAFNNVKETDNENSSDSQVEDNLISPCITPISLYNLIEKIRKNPNDSGTIFLLDVRKASDFEQSRMILPKVDPNKVIILNIPEEVIELGMSSSKLIKLLPLETVNALKERRSAKKVILFDWTSEEMKNSDYLEALFAALWKWDSGAERIKSPPIILKSGFHGWCNHFPTLTTNPRVTPPALDNTLSKERLIIDFYSQIKSLDNEPSSFNQKEEIGNKHEDSQELESKKQKLTQVNDICIRFSNNNFKENNIKIPGSAQLVPPVDRSIKPKEVSDTFHSLLNTKSTEISHSNFSNSETLDKSKLENEFKLIKIKEAEEELEKIRIKKEEDDRLFLNKIQDDNKKLREENLNLKRFLKPKYHRFVSTPTDQVNIKINKNESDKENFEETNNIKSNDSNGERFVLLQKSNTEISRTNNERTVSESSSISRPKSLVKTGKSLSRSYSSPNIAELFAEENYQDSKVSKSPLLLPAFDRSLKPSTLINDLNSRNFSINPVRSRNFSPVYGIPGHVNTGLRNLGNTCFLNAIIQCLADTNELSLYFMQERHLSDINRNSLHGSNGELAEELGALIRQIRGNQYKSVSPKDFKNAIETHMPLFVGCDQQDSHEFLCMLLEKLHADLNRVSNSSITSSNNFTISDDLPTHIAINKFWTNHIRSNISIISELFEGLLMSTLKCTYCDTQSNTFEVFTNLSLPIPSKLGHRCSLIDCLRLFSEPESLRGEAAWECPTCKTKREAIKKITLCKLPKVLVIHLKRFSYDGMWRQKLQTFVEFPLTDFFLKNYRYFNYNEPNESLVYNLHGIVNHHGTLEGGHYIAYCKSQIKNKWYKYDDHEVTEISAADVKTHAAYILFFTSDSLQKH